MTSILGGRMSRRRATKAIYWKSFSFYLNSYWTMCVHWGTLAMRLTCDHSLERLLVSNTRSDTSKVGIGSIWRKRTMTEFPTFYPSPIQKNLNHYWCHFTDIYEKCDSLQLGTEIFRLTSSLDCNHLSSMRNGNGQGKEENVNIQFARPARTDYYKGLRLDGISQTIGLSPLVTIPRHRFSSSNTLRWNRDNGWL